MNAPEGPLEKQSWCDWLCSCGKKKAVETEVDKIAERSITVKPSERPLDLQTVRHGRLNSQELIPIQQALAWNGHYSIKEPTQNKDNPDQINIKDLK
jgi:hypothetical protein